MKKFGDLLFNGETNNSLHNLLTKTFSIHKQFDDVWESLCTPTNTAQYMIYNNANVLIDEKYYHDNEGIYASLGRQSILYDMGTGTSHPFIDYLRGKLAEDTDIYQTIFSPYAEDFLFYKEDTQLCICYNLAFNQRCQLNKDVDRYNDTNSLAQDNEYFLPFNLLDNKYEDFCTYTWKSIFKDSQSVICLNDYTKKRKYFNTQSFDRIMETLSYNNKDSPTLITNNDRWLIEKIFGVNTVLSLMPIFFTYYDKATTETIIFPLLNLLLSCRPIKIRIALADLVFAFLLQIPTIRKTSPYYNANNNELYDKTLVSELYNVLEDTIKLININYYTIINTFYNAIQAKTLTFNIPNEIIKPKISTGVVMDTENWEIQLPYELLDSKIAIKETAYDTLFNQIGLKNMNEKLSFYPRKRTYNNNDLAWRYGCLQFEAISTNYNLYHHDKE